MNVKQTSGTDFVAYISSVEDIIEEARRGKMFILVDDEDRENEGDLVIPAQMASSDAVNFMAKYGRGLICLALTPERVEQLGLNLMERRNESRLSTAFTVSIEAREGISTGISAADRARTIAVAVDPKAGKEDIVTPGHVFPLVAREGGVLIRTGHTEAAVDVARLAGLYPAGVICEIMNEDGTMARRDDLVAFSQRHNLKITTIANLIEYRRRTEKIVERVREIPFTSRYGGEFRLVVYRNIITNIEHIALVKGEISPEDATLVRVHALDIFHDALGAESLGSGGGELESAMKIIAQEDKGVVVVIRNPKLTAMSNDLSPVLLKKERKDQKGQENQQKPLRDYGEGAQILLDLGVKNMVLLHNTKHVIIGLEGYGLQVLGQKKLPVTFS